MVGGLLSFVLVENVFLQEHFSYERMLSAEDGVLCLVAIVKMMK